LLPRAGRRKTMNARKTEVEEAYGQFGCLAIDNLYNIYDLTDRTPLSQHSKYYSRSITHEPSS
jgi:hypothetical protein